MRVNWTNIRAFLTAEEVPRWIGLSLTGLLIFGLGAVSIGVLDDARVRSAERLRDTADSSVELLASSLSRIPAEQADQTQLALREYTRWYQCDTLRVVSEDGRILCSIDNAEIGTSAALSPDVRPAATLQRLTRDMGAESGEQPKRMVVVGFDQHLDEHGTGEERTSRRYLQSVLTQRATVGLADAGMGTSIAAVTVIVLFLLVYRALRRHFRSMSLISENLMSRGDQIESDLHSLRLTDIHGALADQWNRLVDLVEEMSADTRRASASAELTAVLQKSGRGELAEVVNAVPDGLIHVADDWRVNFANSMAQRLFEISIAEGESPRLDELQASSVGQVIIERLNESRGPDGEAVAMSSVVETDGGESHYRVRLVPFARGKRAGQCVITITDISQQVRADKASEEFIAQLTHELRTPLANIRAYTETLSSGMFDDPKVIADCYNVITKETRRLARLIDDILSASQLEVGTIQIHADNVDLGALLTEAVRDLRGLADEKQLDMQLSLPSKMPTLQADRDKLAVVVNNLLGNALKYTPGGGEIRVGCQVSADVVLITVKDTGIGIDSADNERVFEKFQRGSNPVVEEIEGTGIGLATAREIARRHGGDIELMSVPGEGSTFIVRLPNTSNSSGTGASTAPNATGEV